MIYFSNQPVRPDSVDDAQYRALQEFKVWCRANGLVEEYSTLGEFRTKLSRQLALTMLRDEYFQPLSDRDSIGVSIDAAAQQRDRLSDMIASLTEEARVLLVEAAEDSSGHVLKVSFIGGFHVQTNGKQFVEEKDPRSRAAWEQAVDQLCNLGLLQERGYKGEVFAITAEGYRVADAIRLQEE